MIGINQFHWSSALPRVAQPYRWITLINKSRISPISLRRKNRRVPSLAAHSMLGQLAGTRAFGRTDAERAVGGRGVASRIRPSTVLGLPGGAVEGWSRIDR